VAAFDLGLLFEAHHNKIGSIHVNRFSPLLIFR
jgi:hypothetical protein